MRCDVPVATLVSGLSTSLLAQQPSNLHQQTTPPPGARFEILQSQLVARLTFRLDRFTGHVAQLVKTKEDDNAWDEMQVVGLPSIPNPARARFQLFTSGIAARHTFLIDADTGKSWVVVTAKRKFPLRVERTPPGSVYGTGSAGGSGISRFISAELSDFPCASSASDRVTPPPSARVMTKFRAPSCGSS
jgi:hypothetical protein